MATRRLVGFLILLTAAFNANAFAGEVHTSASLAPQWQALLHIDKSSNTSRVDNPAFFISPVGKSDPEAELQATIRALQEPATRVGRLKLPADCAFPARARWIRSFLGDLPPPPPCNTWQQWRQGIEGSESSLVYSSSFKGSPGSMFGHTFIRFGGNANNLSGYVVSYAAETQGAGAISYVVNGLTGGFPGKISVQPYYLKVKEYDLTEERDLVEYPLNLTVEQTDLMVAHVWELYTSGGFDYYFLDENCAGILLAIIDVAQPNLNLWEQRPTVVSPLSSLQQLASVPDLLEQPSANIAASKKANLRYANLTPQQRVQVNDLLDESTLTDKVTDPRVLEATIDLLQTKKFRSAGSLSHQDKSLLEASLSKRAALPPSPSILKPPQMDTSSPTRGHAPGALTSGYLPRLKATRISLRHGYHGLGDAPIGYDPDLAITYLSPSVLLTPDRALFEHLTLLDMTALAPISKFQSRPSWQVNSYCTGSGCRVDGGIGGAWALGRFATFYLIPKLAVTQQGETTLAGLATTGLVLRPMPFIQFASYVAYESPVGAAGKWSATSELNWQVLQNFQIHQTFTDAEGYLVGIRQYF